MAEQDQKEREDCRDALCYGVVISKYYPERRTGKPGMQQQSMGSQRVGHNCATEQNKDVSLFFKNIPNKDRMQEDRMLPLMSDTHSFPPGDLHLYSFFLAPLLLQGPGGSYRLSQPTHGLSLRSVGQTNLFYNMPVWTKYP